MRCGLKRFQKAEALHFITFSCIPGGSSFTHYATDVLAEDGIESEWTARLRGPLIAKEPR
jgi:hypothetical protein